MDSHTGSPWHGGERVLQHSAGVADRMEVFGRKVIRNFMPEQHRVFFQQQPFLVVAAVDAAGDPWITLVEAKAGLAHSPDPQTLQINQLPSNGDPVGAALAVGDSIGVLGIELATRRRNRVNGSIVARSDTSLTLQVEHSFGNCPQYIQTRHAAYAADPANAFGGPVETLAALDADATALIRAADTFFVASYVDLDGNARQRQVDASHRGGKPGFVRVDDQTLSIPDFAGNLHFNTLGNLQVNPRAGLVFMDFSTGDMLQLTGRAELVLEGSEVRSFQGAERIWRVHVEKVVRRRSALQLRWTLDTFSPNALMTGSWEQALARKQADVLRHDWRRFRIARIARESRTIKSFYLEPTDGAGLALFTAGQHLPIRLTLAADTKPCIRTYTLSAAPSDSYYRISVKREGVFSQFLHDQVHVGAVIEARAPAGDFVVDGLESRPLVLLSAGVGITPLLAMLRTAVYEGLRKRRMRKTFFIHAARTLAERAFDAELQALQQRGGDAISVLRVLSQPESGVEPGRDFDYQGRINVAYLKSVLPLDDYDFYLCGPSAFTQDLYDGLRALRIADDRLHAEQFGPSTLRRTPPEAAAVHAPANPAPAAQAAPVLFARAMKEARWQPGCGSLLELAEARGLSPEFSCRGGSCGTCKTRLMAGQVSYTTPPALQLAEDEVLICCCVPAARQDGAQGLVLDL
ncbi:MAG: pyridoxamine 5'-phosphate oxidase family protein [Pseudomonadota bacterium]